MNFKARLKALEQASRGGGDVVLRMADGSQRTITLRRSEDLLALFQRIIRNPNSEETLLIRSAVEIREPDGSHMLELARAGFVDQPTEPEPTEMPKGETL
jgi:hypothetical protein